MAVPIRERICTPVGFLGIRLDPDLNEKNVPLIPGKNGSIKVQVIKTNEELMIVQHTRDIMNRRVSERLLLSQST